MKKIFLFLFFIFLSIFSYPLHAQTLGIGSYEVLSSEKTDYLKSLVQEALQSNLTDSEKRPVRIISLSEKQIKSSGLPKILKQEKLDAVLVGSILKAGTPIQINSRLYLSNQEAQNISDQAENSDQLLCMLKKHAEKIKQLLNGAAPVVQANPVLPPPTQIVSKKKTPTLLMSPLSNKPAVAESSKTQNSNFIEFPDYQWMSDRLSFEARGLAQVHLKETSKSTLVLIDLNHVYLYEFANQSLKLVSTYEGKKSDQFVRVYTQDLDGDGDEEVIVSNIAYGQASSFILKYKTGGEFQVLANKIPWLLKTIIYQGNSLLLGEVFYGKEQDRHKIKKLKYQDSKVVEEGDWLTPGEVGLYGLQGVLGDKQQEQIVYLTPSGTLKIYKTVSGHMQKNWSSSETYGGSANYIQLPVRNVLNQEEENNTFFNMDPVTWLNEKGDLEVFAPKNDTFLKNVIGTKPIFKNSWLVKLKQDSSGLREQWSSKKVDGAILDLISYNNEKGIRQILALFWLRDKGVGASFKRYPSVLALYEVK